MNNALVIKVLAFCIGGGVTSVLILGKVLSDIAEQKQRTAEEIAETNAVLRAGRYVMTGLSDGDYEGKPEQALIDFEFIRLVERID